jgi:hypothetical protein
VIVLAGIEIGEWLAVGVDDFEAAGQAHHSVIAPVYNRKGAGRSRLHASHRGSR